MKFLLLHIVISINVFVGPAQASFDVPNVEAEKTKNFWMNSMQEEIQQALRKQINDKIAKNIIIFVGDGLGVTAATAGRIYKGQKRGFSGEEFSLSWEKFSNMALLKTYNLDKQVPDSAGTATAYFGGVKNNHGTLGVTGNVAKGDCQKSLDKNNWVTSVLQWAQEAGKDTGIVTTTRVTHATPAALYSHSSHRDWECDSKINETFQELGCKDIARQLIEDLPGKNINVILGGGRGPLGSSFPKDHSSCVRNDSRNLVEEWKKEKMERGRSVSYATTTRHLLGIDTNQVDYIMGLFSGSHTSYELDRDTSPEGTPSIKQMVEVAIKRLKRSSDGYFLMVEGGRIDHGLHESKTHKALEEISAFDDSIASALEIVGADDETLIIVTADHSHVMTINGYPDRGNNILGTTKAKDVVNALPYPTLMFTTGHGFYDTFETDSDGEIVRRNLTGTDTTDPNYISPSIVGTPPGGETHSGEDIAAFALGPMSHLFHKVHEQAYVAHVMGFAACIGPYKYNCDRHHHHQSHDTEDMGILTIYEKSSASSLSFNVMVAFGSSILPLFCLHFVM